MKIFQGMKIMVGIIGNKATMKEDRIYLKRIRKKTYNKLTWTVLVTTMIILII